MNYQQQLTPWVIHRLLPNLTQRTISRFRRRNEAEAYMRWLQQHQPNAEYTIAFDVGQNELVQQGES